MEWTHTVLSFAQKVHSAFETCTKLLRYSNLSALKLITGLVNLTLEMLLLFDEVSEVLEMRTLRGSSADNRLVEINPSRKYADLQVLSISYLFSFPSTLQCSVALVLRLAET
jgi:hypothetical protein